MTGIRVVVEAGGVVHGIHPLSDDNAELLNLTGNARQSTLFRVHSVADIDARCKGPSPCNARSDDDGGRT